MPKIKYKKLSSTNSPSPQLRLRIFAGPNGSGKSTIIKSVRNTKISGQPIDFGYYINADDITQLLSNGGFKFALFDIKFNNERFVVFTEASGLLNGDFDLKQFRKSYNVKGNSIVLTKGGDANRIGQIIARFLREEMLLLKKRFSFETVFSHGSNLDIMKRAAKLVYKVYLYFVSTESPEINKYRVNVRVKSKGHDVPPCTIEKRYYRSLDLLYDAAQLAYQAFFFDNSQETFELIAHFKKQGEDKNWDPINENQISNWFKIYYSGKINK